MANTLKYIAKREGGKHGNPVLFFPEYETNSGNIAFYAHVGQHGEAACDYYRGLQNCRAPHQKLALKELLNEYRCNYLGKGEMLMQVARDTQKMREKRWERL